MSDASNKTGQPSAADDLDATIDRIEVTSYKIPTDAPESDGTLQWDATGLVVVHAWAGDARGLGYSYTSAASAAIIEEKLAGAVVGRRAMDVPGSWAAMAHVIRNLGQPGVCSTAISAVDAALWDLKARLLGLPLVSLLGQVREAAPIYGSGGFTSYDNDQLTKQLGDWVEAGIPRVKMKVGRDARADIGRVRAARAAIGEDVELFVDANGGYSRKIALEMAEIFRDVAKVSWFEEPRPSADLDGLRLLVDRGPAGMAIAAGEYGYDLPYFRRMLDAGAVDCLQADVTRCGGVSMFLAVAALCDAREMPLSAHCAPNLSAHVCCAAQPLRHIEYFHDHVRIERMLFDGVLDPESGKLEPDRTRPGMGLELKRDDAEAYRL